MKKVKTAIIIASVLVILGTAAVLSALAIARFDISAFSTETYTDKAYDITDDFSDLKIDVSSANINIVSVSEEKAKVVCRESEHMTFEVTNDGTSLSIVQKITGKWYERIGVFGDEAKVCIYLPEKTYNTLSVTAASGSTDLGHNTTFSKMNLTSASGNVTVASCSIDEIDIDTSSGNVSVEKAAAKYVNISTVSGKISVDALEKGTGKGAVISLESTSGKINIEHTICDSLTVSSVSGDFEADSLILDGKLTVSSSSGKVRLDYFDAGEMEIETVSGNVIGSLITEKRFVTETVSGKIKVPISGNGGICKIVTTSGDIEFTMSPL